MTALATQYAKMVRGKVARLTLLDVCGNPVPTNSSYVTKGIVTVNSTKNMDNGDEIKVREMDGIIGTYEPGRESLLNFSIEINFTGINPAAIAMLTGDPALMDSRGNVAGWSEQALQQLLQNFALEVWTDTSAGLCVNGTNKLVGYMLYPLISQAYVTIDNISDKEVTATVQGISYGNPQWGKGPYGNGPSRSVADASFTSGSPNVTSATATFTSADIGKTLTATQLPAGTTILSVTSATVVVASANATAAGTAQNLQIGDGSSGGGPVDQATTGVPVPGRLLTPVTAAEHRRFLLTSIAPPTSFVEPMAPQTITLPSPY